MRAIVTRVDKILQNRRVGCNTNTATDHNGDRESCPLLVSRAVRPVDLHLYHSLGITLSVSNEPPLSEVKAATHKWVGRAI